MNLKAQFGARQSGVRSQKSAPEDQIKLDDVRDDCNAILVPEYDIEKEAYAYIEERCVEIFERELKIEVRKIKS